MENLDEYFIVGLCCMLCMFILIIFDISEYKKKNYSVWSFIRCLKFGKTNRVYFNT